MRIRPTMLLAGLLAVGLMPIAVQAQLQGNQQPTPRQTIENTDPDNTFDRTPDARRGAQGTATQERTERAPQFRGDQRPQGVQGMEEQLSLTLAAKMAIMNDCEIKTAQLANEKIDNEEVKQYAQSVIRDHQQLNQRLLQAMPEVRDLVNLQSSDRTSATTPGAETQSAQSTARGADSALQNSPAREASGTAQSPQREGSELSRDATQRATGYRGVAQDGSRDAMQRKMLDICEKTARNSFEMTKREFSEKQGKDLAMCYMGSQIVVHQQAVAHLQALQGEGTEEFQQIVQQAEETMQHHLTQAKSIVEQLAQESDRTQPATRTNSNGQNN